MVSPSEQGNTHRKEKKEITFDPIMKENFAGVPLERLQGQPGSAEHALLQYAFPTITDYAALASFRNSREGLVVGQILRTSFSNGSLDWERPPVAMPSLSDG